MVKQRLYTVVCPSYSGPLPSNMNNSFNLLKVTTTTTTNLHLVVPWTAFCLRTLKTHRLASTQDTILPPCTHINNTLFVLTHDLLS